MTLAGGPVGDWSVSAGGSGMFVAVASTTNTNNKKILYCGDMALIDRIMRYMIIMYCRVLRGKVPGMPTGGVCLRLPLSMS